MDGYPQVELGSDAGRRDGAPWPWAPPPVIAQALNLRPGEDWCLEVPEGEWSESEWSDSGETASQASSRSRWSEAEKIDFCYRKCTYAHPLSPTTIYRALTELDLSNPAPWRVVASGSGASSSFQLPIRPRAAEEFEDQEACDVQVFSTPSSSSSDAV